ncbi:hypothetical protein [Dyella sp. 2RAB6]|uniref:hypothetical protein n=1 Tax=Dyella sp. 2RAB6 TaxID=3232992 RepID=UPI003F928010
MDIPSLMYETVASLAKAMFEANKSGQTAVYWRSYNLLRGYCEEQEAQGVSHPFPWETLADFTRDDIAAVPLYLHALKYAERTDTYRASILFELARRYQGCGRHEAAWTSATAANECAASLDDADLRRDIGRFMLELSAGR